MYLIIWGDNDIENLVHDTGQMQQLDDIAFLLVFDINMKI